MVKWISQRSSEPLLGVRVPPEAQLGPVGTKYRIMLTIPIQIKNLTHILEKAGFEAYVVGGPVRDLLLGKTPKDWDITTNAKPEEVVPLFQKAVYENQFGTVAVIDEKEEADSPFKNIEVTTYRSETTYSDNRHPDAIEFATTLEEDLKRRDFTINAMAYNVSQETLIDLYQGQNDLKNKVIQTVGKADERFKEDALRILRAVRFSAQLEFTIAPETQSAISKFAPRLEKISNERIRDEFAKIVMSKNPKAGLHVAHQLGILPYISRELDECFGVGQNKSHVFDVGTHLINSLQHAADKEYPLFVRLAALFHDIGKPPTKRLDKKTSDYTFYGHEVVGARITKRTLERLRFSKRTVEDVTTLVRYHMFFSDPDLITLSAVRRIITNVGEDKIWDLIHLRYCDRIGMGRPTEDPYRLRRYEAMIEEALRDPISVKMLKLNGDIMIKEMGFNPGRRMGWILHALLEDVLDDPSRNTREYLEEKAKKLNELPDSNLSKLGEAGKETKEAADAFEVKKLRKKHKVQ